MYGNKLTKPELKVLNCLLDKGPIYEGNRGDIRLPQSISDTKHLEAIKTLVEKGYVTYDAHRGKLRLKLTGKGRMRMWT